MAHAYHHAESSASRFGGAAEDYLAVHEWFDRSKQHAPAFTHRILRHHTFGIFEARQAFGPTVENSVGRQVPTTWLGEQHVREDCGGFIPSVVDWTRTIRTERWMNAAQIEGPPTGGDQREDWVAAVVAGRTVMGFEDWLAERSTG